MKTMATSIPMKHSVKKNCVAWKKAAKREEVCNLQWNFEDFFQISTIGMLVKTHPQHGEITKHTLDNCAPCECKLARPLDH